MADERNESQKKAANAAWFQHSPSRPNACFEGLPLTAGPNGVVPVAKLLAAIYLIAINVYFTSFNALKHQKIIDPEATPGRPLGRAGIPLS